MTGLKRYKERYDVVVAGAGFGGITAAMRLAQLGADVLLLEQHNMIGGYETSFVRGRFEFEATLHVLMEFGEGLIEKIEQGEPAGAHGRARRLLVEQLGVDIEVHRPDDMYHCILSDYGINMKMPFGRKKCIEAIEKLSPGDGEKMARYLDVCEEMAEVLEYIESEPKIDIMKILKEHTSFVRLAGYSVAEVNEQFGFSEKTLQALSCMVGFLGLSFRVISFPVWAVMMHRYFMEGSFIPEKTSHYLANKAELRLRELGVQVECCAKVERFLTQGDKVVGVEMADGENIYAKHVLCNALPTIAITEMLPADFIPKRMRKLYNVRHLSVAPFALYLGLDKTAKELGITSYEYFIADNLDTEKIAEVVKHWIRHPKLVVTCTDTVIPGCVGEGCCHLGFAELYHTDAMMEALDRYGYQKTNEDLANHLIDRFERDTGAHIREHIEEISIATPATFQRYANAMRGNVYGYEQTPVDNVISRTLNKDKERFIKGLDFVGGATFRTVGVSSVISSGVKVAEDVWAEIRN